MFLFSISCKNSVEDSIDPIDPSSTIDTPNPDWTTDSHSKEGVPNYSIVFPQEKVNSIEITLGSATWSAIKADMRAKNRGTFGLGGGLDGADGNFGDDLKYVEVTLKFNNKTWTRVGFRLKGNSTLNKTWKAGSFKLPFRLQFDEFEDIYPSINGQRLYGFKEISMSPGALDNSLIREKVTADIFRMAGIPAPKTAFTKVYIDFGEGLKYCGIYAMVELVDDNMLKDQYGEKNGNIYKPESKFTSFKQAQFEKKNNKTAADWSDVQGIITALNASNRTSNAEAWRTNLESRMNMDSFIKWLAVNTTMVNWDTYGAIAHNYYLYNHSTKKVVWIPWDNNEALTGVEIVNLSLSRVNNTWPLIKYVAEDPIYFAKYKIYVREFATNVFTPAKMNETLEKATNLISPFVNGTEREVAPYSNLINMSNFTSSLNQLKQHVIDRNSAVNSFLR